MNNHGIVNGLMMGIALSAVTLVLYLVNPALVLNMPLNFFLGTLVPIFFMRRAVLGVREEQEGNLSLAEGLIPAMVCFAIGSLMLIILTYVLFQVDANLVQMQKDMAIEMTKQIWGMLPETMQPPAELQAQEFEKIQNRNFTGAGTMIGGWAIQLLFPGFIIAIIIAAILRKENYS